MNSPQPWKTLASRQIVADRWLGFRADVCELPSGVVLDPFYVLEEKDWVHIAARNAAGAFLVVQQYRYAGGVTCVELPGGVIDPGEDPLVAAQRELREETGYEAARWSAVATAYANPARQTNRVFVFLAEDLIHAGEQELDHSEEIAVAFASVAELKKLIQEGVFNQLHHIGSLYLALDALAPSPPPSGGEGVRMSS